MLAQTIVLLAFIAIFAASIVTGVAGAARAHAANAARALMLPAVESALGRYQRAIGQTIALQRAQADAASTSLPAALPALANDFVWLPQRSLEVPSDDTPERVAVTIEPAAQTRPSCASGGGGPDRAVALQCSAFVQESRLALDVRGDAGPVDDAGSVSALAHARYIVTLRLFAEPPYAMVSGVKDASDPAAFHEGDTGGFGNALGAFATPAPDDTTIHVVYACADGTGSCALSAPPSLDAPATRPWTNGNGAAAPP